MITGTAVKVYTMTTDAPDAKALVRFANSLAADEDGIGLDSLDLGDTMGFFIQHLDAINWSTDNAPDTILVAPEGFTVTISYTWENFRWEGIDEMQTAFNKEEL